MKIKHYKNSYYEYFYYLDKDNNKIRHRDDDLPAFIYSEGTKYCFQHGKLHRESGPAIELSDGDLLYYYHDKFLGRSSKGYTKEQFKQDLYIIKNNLFAFL